MGIIQSNLRNMLISLKYKPTNNNNKDNTNENNINTPNNVIKYDESIERMTSIEYENNQQSIESIEINRYHTIPHIKQGEVLIKVIAIGLNPIDIKLIEYSNLSKTIRPLPKTLGCEFSGKVVSTIGCYTDYLSIGDEVVGMIPFLCTSNGAASEYITINENLVAKVPSNVSIIDVTGIPFVGLTVVEALQEYVTKYSQYPETTNGKKILIQGAAGGIGTFAIQYCKNVLGMYIIATCSQNNIQFLRSLGVDEVIDYEQVR